MRRRGGAAQRVRGEGDCPLCLAFIDIDNFKAINTEICHDKADLVIIELSKILGELLVGRGKLYHRSGDGFLVCLHNSDGNEAKYLFDGL
ncbi:MAG: diguanylate cyclase [Rickettsiales bacterium]